MAKYNPKYYQARKEKKDIDKSYHNIYTAPQRRRNKKKETARRRKTIIGICIFVILLAIAALAATLYFMETEEEKTILDNVSIAGIDVGGLTKDEAITKVTRATKNTYSSMPMTITVLDTTVQIPVTAVGELDIEEAVKEAYDFGNKGSKSERERAKKIAKESGYAVEITEYFHLDTEMIRSELDQLGVIYNSELSQSTYEIVGSIPTQQQLANNDSLPKLVIYLGERGYGLDTNKLYDQVIAAYNNNEFSVVGECGMRDPDPIDLDGIYAQYCKNAVDATKDPETMQITDAQYGYAFDLAKAKTILENASLGTTVEIAFFSIAPEVTADDLVESMFRDELASWEATEASDADRATNLRVACQSIDGIVLYPGDVFSYNNTLGPRTEANGYKPGPSYAGGTVVYTIGGGICQVSSVLYYCTVLADLEIIDRECHGFMPHYMEPGTDAMVSWGTYDFQFRNNTKHPIRIEAEAQGGTVKVRLMGTDDKDYYVKFESEILEKREAKTTDRVMSPDNSEGYKHGDEIIPTYHGYTTQSYRCKYDKTTHELISREKEAYSYYKVLDGVRCVIKTDTTTSDMSDTGSLPPE